jgi:acyl-CoA synthetase (AMP-forming)/AMP-acid ligase II
MLFRMNGEMLDEILRSFSGDHQVLLTQSAILSVDQLLKDAEDLYRRSSVTSTSRIALCGLLPCDFITALVAFDGKVEAMLLLPASLDEAATLRLVESAGCTHYMDAENIVEVSREQEECRFSETKVESEATQWLLATSGTTGRPKLIGHTLASLSRSVKRDLEKGRCFVWGLLYDPSRFAGIQVVLQALLSGSLLLVSESVDFESQIEGLLQNKVNALSATPSLWRKLLMDGRIKASRLQQITLGGEIADQHILDGLKRQFNGARIVHIYASTEAGTAFSVHDGRAGFPSIWIQNQSAPVPLRIRGDGHLLVRPSILPDGLEIVQRLDSDGYLDTEDMVQVEGDRVIFLGRASGAINVGGNKVIPEYIESHIREVTGVLDVCVFGKKSSMIGQIVEAEIVPHSGLDLKRLRSEIMYSCRSKMESWQIPGIITFVDELKENSAGKRERLT